MRVITSFSLTFLMLFAREGLADSISVTIENIAHREGKIMLQIFASEAEFNGEAEAALSLMQRVTDGTLGFTASGLAPGEYGIRVLHDRDGDGQLSTNVIGMPIEPWGFSNNAAGNFGPPTWDDLRFVIEGSAEQRIQLND